jgi:serine/threonine-protein kinase HipA
VPDVAALAEVWLWGHLVGAVAEEASGAVTFEYSPGFARLGLELSPIALPLSRQGPVSFPELSRLEAFDGLPGVLADSLPDRFGNAVIRKYFEEKGEPEKALSPVQKLLYLGARGMGALEYRPALSHRRTRAEEEAIAVAELVREARRIVGGRVDVAVPHIMRIGASAGGARPKAVVLRNRSSGEVRSDFAAPRPGDEHWIVKFDGVGELGAPDPTPQPYNRIECAYARMARTAGIEVPESELLHERRLAHLLVKRFDRVGERRVHAHTLGGMQHVDYNQPGLFSYEQYLRTVLLLNLGYPALEEAYRRAVFNVAAVNQDDHVKNLSFLMDEAGTWSLSPAYDLTYAKGRGFTRAHQMTVGGKSTGIARKDLLALGVAMGIRRDGAEVIARVTAALGTWETEARAAGVPVQHVRRIAKELLR